MAHDFSVFIIRTSKQLHLVIVTYCSCSLDTIKNSIFENCDPTAKTYSNRLGPGNTKHRSTLFKQNRQCCLQQKISL